MKEDLIAPCGMNCSLCVSYQFGEKNLNKLGFHRSYCPGCIPRGKNCTHMAYHCDLIGEGKIDTTFLISHRLPLEDAPLGYKMFKEEQNETTKVVLKPDWRPAN